MMTAKYDTILVINFGSQYFHLIVKLLNKINIFSETRDYNVDLNDITNLNIKGVILSGGPCSINDLKAPKLKNEVFEYFIKNKIPIFGICYGMQEMAKRLNGEVSKSTTSEYASTDVNIITKKYENDEKYKNFKLTDNCMLFDDINVDTINVWMSHTDKVSKIPDNFYLVNSTDNCIIASYYNEELQIYGVQYHPEVYESQYGQQLFYNFSYKICKCVNTFNPIKYHEAELKNIEKYAHDHYLIGAMSGGIDSTVAAALTYKIFKDKFFGIFIDNGLLRKDEGEKVFSFLKETFPDMNIQKIDSREIFLKSLKGVTDPEEKRKIIGRLFIEEFEKAVKNLNIDINQTYLLQGTLYPDVIESKCSKNISDTIKSHHNVSGLPKDLKFKLFEPFKYLFKDDVKLIAKELNLPNEIINRHPFPGPGLAIRVIGEIDEHKLSILRDVDDIFMQDLKHYNLYDKIDQAFAVLLGTTKSVGVIGDARTYAYVCVLRAVQSPSFMTANWFKIPYDILEKISSHILSKVKGISRVLYDISPKPPATIEFE